MSSTLGSSKALSLDFLRLSTPQITHYLPWDVFQRQKPEDPLWLVHEELNQELDDAVVQTHHFSVLHFLIQPQALCAPQQVLPGVVGVRLHREGHCVELVAEEGEEMAVCDHSLGHERPGDILVVPETYRGDRVWTPAIYINVDGERLIWWPYFALTAVISCKINSAAVEDVFCVDDSPWYMAWAPVQAKRLASPLALRKTSTWSDCCSRAIRSLWYRSGTTWNWVWP